MKISLLLAMLFFSCFPGAKAAESPPLEAQAGKKVYVLPIRDDIMPPLVYVVRRGVKEAMEAKADTLILDMETNGGRVDTTEEIISILNRFKGRTVTYVNQKAFSAGAFIAVATQQIYMAPQSVIGAAAPMLMIPGGGPSEMPATVEAKMTSGIRALVRANAEKNGYNVEVVEAMIDKSRELEIDGEVLNEKGQILTLTDKQAEKLYGSPAKPLLSSGTVASVDELIELLGYSAAARVTVEPTGAERLGTWINAVSPLLLMIGLVGLYIEFKTPGFGLPGIAAIIAFTIYFLGGYVAGLSGAEWLALFVLGLILLLLEFFVFPGTAVLGLAGAGLMIASILMAMVDVYPSMPNTPASMRFDVPVDAIVQTLVLTLAGTGLALWGLRLFLPRTALYHALVSHTAAGEGTILAIEETNERRLGETGVALSTLRPGGKARFGEDALDVISRGEMIAKGQPVKIIGFSGRDAIVEMVSAQS